MPSEGGSISRAPYLSKHIIEHPKVVPKTTYKDKMAAQQDESRPEETDFEEATTSETECVADSSAHHFRPHIMLARFYSLWLQLLLLA